LLTIVAGVFAEVFVRGEIIVRDDPAATAANMLIHESLYRLGLAADLIMLLSYVVVTLLFSFWDTLPTSVRSSQLSCRLSAVSQSSSRRGWHLACRISRYSAELRNCPLRCG
jgi:hypothetical protein